MVLYNLYLWVESNSKADSVAEGLKQAFQDLSVRPFGPKVKIGTFCLQQEHSKTRMKEVQSQARMLGVKRVELDVRV